MTTAARPTAAQLRDLYVRQRMSTRQIAALYGVQKTSVGRWLTHHQIDLRAATRGLANRGVTAPSRAELHQLVHVDHLSYREIAERFGVDHSAVPLWLDQHEIPRPTVWGTRRRGAVVSVPPPAELRQRYESGEPLRDIATAAGVDRSTITGALRAAGVEIRPDGWNGGRRLTCTDGHPARSVYEQRVDDWLTEHGFAHDIEPRLPFDRRCRADFLVGAVYVEVWGVVNRPSYTARRQRKTRLYAQHGLPLVGLPVHSFSKGTWRRRLAAGLAAAGATA
jgi:transposase